MSHSNDHAANHHVDSVGTYIATFGALTILMIATIAAAQVNFGHSIVNNIIAMTIAILKATLVIAIFMAVRRSSGLVKLYAIGGFVWFLLFFIMFCDYATRSWEPVKGWYGEESKVVPDYPHVTDHPGERPEKHDSGP